MTKKIAGCLAAACLFFIAFSNLSAAGLNPQNTGVTAASADFSWTSSGGPYNAVLSDTGTFVTTVYSGITALTSVTYPGLNSNTTYYFKVKRVTDINYEETSAATFAAAPSGIYFNPEGFQSYLLGSLINAGWDINNNHPETIYQVDYGQNNDFLGALTTSRGYPPVDIGGLLANTMYHFRVRAVSRTGALTTNSAIASTATLALALSNINSAVYQTSATVSWNAVSNPYTPSLNSQGYRLDLSLSETMTPLLPGWSTTNPDNNAANLTFLQSNTTYYYRAGSLNQEGAVNWTYQRSFMTLSAQPQNLQFTGAGISTQTATLGWTALPASPPSATAAGYRLEASSTNFDGTDIYRTTATYNVLNNTLTLSGLDANTTYYFRIASLNQNYTPHYSQISSSITLSVPLSANLLKTITTPFTLTVNLSAPLPSGPQNSTCEGYLLEASSRNFVPGSQTYSLASYSNLTNSMTLNSLRPNTTYYLRIATLNWTKTPSFSADLPAVLTAMGDNLTSAPLAGIWQSSAAVSFSSLDSDGYVLDASQIRYFDPIAASSSTPDAAASGLTVTGLDENTLYYFQTGVLYNGATVYTNTNPAKRCTLPLPLTDAAIAGVYYTSATISWTPLAGTSQKTSAESYHLEVSTSADFARLTYAASANDIRKSSLTVQDLQPNTNYYFRAGTVNMDGAETYVFTPATSTLAKPAIQTAFTGFATGQLTVNWTANSNPPDTVYRISFYSDPGYSSLWDSYDTLNTYATFPGLSPNTTYYPQMTVINRLNVPEGPHNFSAMATLAYDPQPGAVSSLGVSSLTLNWGIGNNPSGSTYYKAEISSSPAFAPPVLSALTLATSYTFHGLVSDATYYLRVSALNHTGVETEPKPSVSSDWAVLTKPATAYVLPHADTFSDLMIDGFTLHWAANGNSSHTSYYIEISTYNTEISTNIAVSDAGNRNGWAISTSTTLNDLSWRVKELQKGTTYWAKIQSKSQTGIPSDSADFVFTGTITTLSSAQGGALVSKETTILLQTSYGPISLFIPAGALGGSTRITIEPATFTVTELAPSAASVLWPTGIGLKITCTPPVLILTPVTITLPYWRSDMETLDKYRSDNNYDKIIRSRIILAYYDEINRLWVPLPSVSNVSDPANNNVTARTWHLSSFQLMGASPPASLATVKIYPNPYTPSSVSGVMHFTNMPPYAKVKIYTFLGELVKEFSADISGMAYWDGSNSGGQKAASGVYLALIKTSDKSSNKVVKVVIER